MAAFEIKTFRYVCEECQGVETVQGVEKLQHCYSFEAEGPLIPDQVLVTYPTNQRRKIHAEGWKFVNDGETWKWQGNQPPAKLLCPKCQPKDETHEQQDEDQGSPDLNVLSSFYHIEIPNK